MQPCGHRLENSEPLVCGVLLGFVSFPVWCPESGHPRLPRGEAFRFTPFIMMNAVLRRLPRMESGVVLPDFLPYFNVLGSL